MINNGSTAIPSLTATVTDMDANQFEIVSNGCRGMLGPGQALVIKIRLKATFAGFKLAFLEIVSP